MKPTRIAVSKPCGNCPFRSDVEPFLRPARVRAIHRAAVKSGEHFVCHKTVNYSLEPDVLDVGRRACAGFLILCRRDGVLGGLQFVQLAERLAGIDFDSLLPDDSSVYESWPLCIEAHERAEGKGR